jgi:hypothetical protein
MKVFRLLSNTNLNKEKIFFNLIKHNYLTRNNIWNNINLSLFLNNDNKKNLINDFPHKIIFESDSKIGNIQDIAIIQNRIIDKTGIISIVAQDESNKEEEISINLKGRNSRVPKRVNFI